MFGTVSVSRDFVGAGRGGVRVAEIDLGRDSFIGGWSCCGFVAVCDRGGKCEEGLYGILGVRLCEPEPGHRGVESSPTPIKFRRSMSAGWGRAVLESCAE